LPPKFGDLQRYCERDGWVLIRNTDHWYFEKTLSNGNVLQTKVSHATHKEIPAHLWNQKKTFGIRFNSRPLLEVFFHAWVKNISPNLATAA